MKNEILNLTENEYTELLNTAKAQINAVRNVPRNLWNMKLFYERHIDSDKKVLQAVAVLQIEKVSKLSPAKMLEVSKALSDLLSI